MLCLRGLKDGETQLWYFFLAVRRFLEYLTPGRATASFALEGKVNTAIAIIGVIIGGWFLLHRRKQRRSKPYMHSPFACVSLRFFDNACDAVKALQGIRFLRNAAPLVPLCDCNRADCRCTYVHHADRRHHDRRERYAATGINRTERRINRLDRRRNSLLA